MRLSYHESGLLARLEASLPGAPTFTDIVSETEYNAKGQRLSARFGAGVLTSYAYDEKTFRIRRMTSRRTSDDKVLQDLRFIYDPVGNIVEQQDDAQQDVYFGNAVVSPKGLYEYDALYRLVKAEGREHPGQQPDASDLPWSNLPHPNVQNALVRYTEHYFYDEVGNILRMQHQAGTSGWTRHYQYDRDGQGRPLSNRLLATSLPGDPPKGPYSATYTHDAAGNMTSMPHLQAMDWDWASRLSLVSKGGGGDVYFHYAPDGQRVRKVYIHGSTVDERIYLDSFELYRRRTAGAVETERSTLHLRDGDKRLAMAETLTVDRGSPVPAPSARLRFQLPNHLESVCVETDAQGNVITYEEYHPYGTTAFRAVAPNSDVSPKRYRYTGMERDEETSLAYHTARYYAPWLTRWTSPDPLGLVDGPSLYVYATANPVKHRDASGEDTESPEELYCPMEPNECGPLPENLVAKDEATINSLERLLQNPEIRAALLYVLDLGFKLHIKAVGDESVRDLQIAEGGAMSELTDDGFVVYYNMDAVNSIAAAEGSRPLSREEVIAHEFGHVLAVAMAIDTIAQFELKISAEDFRLHHLGEKSMLMFEQAKAEGDQLAMEFEVLAGGLLVSLEHRDLTPMNIMTRWSIWQEWRLRHAE